jgi:protein SCO1
MGLRRLLSSVVLFCLLVSRRAESAGSVPASNRGETNVQTFAARGVVKELKTDGKAVVIQHKAISNYMDAMTMPFKAQGPNELAGLQIGDEISFRLRVTDTESWIDQIVKIGTAPLEANKQPAQPQTEEAQNTRPRHPLLDYKFTNELGRAVSLGEFRGQALAITFFFTRCPIPDYCPRLSKNFQEASQKLGSLPGGPTNWHFLSVSFDTEFDTPPVLKAYGERYQYDPKRWSFLTGPADKISELARLSGVKIDGEGGLLNHNFRTLIVDASGRLQTTFPFGGNLSEAVVQEIVKAAAVTNRLISPDPHDGQLPTVTEEAAGQSADPVAR